MFFRLPSYCILIIAAGAILSCQKTDTATSQKTDQGKKINAYWSELPSIPSYLPARDAALPENYRVLKLDLPVLRQQIASGINSTDSTAQLLIPLADKINQNYIVSESKSVPRGKKGLFPEIKMYTGKQISDSTSRVSIELTREGFNGMVSQRERIAVIEPYIKGDTVHYLSFFKKRRTIKKPNHRPVEYSKPVKNPTQVGK